MQGFLECMVYKMWGQKGVNVECECKKGTNKKCW